MRNGFIYGTCSWRTEDALSCIFILLLIAALDQGLSFGEEFTILATGPAQYVA